MLFLFRGHRGERSFEEEKNLPQRRRDAKGREEEKNEPLRRRDAEGREGEDEKRRMKNYNYLE